MTTEGALDAAKRAALKSLLEETEASYIETDNAKLSSTAQKRVPRTRRYKRKREERVHSVQTREQHRKDHDATPIEDISDTEHDINPQPSTVEYEPELASEAVKRSHVSEEDASQILDVLQRFEKRALTFDSITEQETVGLENISSDEKGESHHHDDHKSSGAHKSTKTSLNKNSLDISNGGESTNGNVSEDDVDDDEDNKYQEKANGSGSAEVNDEKISRKKWKEERRNLISRLKAVAPDPSVVDAWDITAIDPVLLATLKCVRSSVVVPGNWRQKRKYLQNKRGLEKRALPLPSYIEALGVGVTREAQRDSDAKKTMKQKQREKMRAKLGSVADEVDDQRLYDAFFKFQTKPHLTALGDIYYELRELDVDAHNFRPGVLSNALREALEIKESDPVPWLVGMQRWGPPPGWPGLSVPGVNAPIPPGARFGYQPGEWGKPPVDEFGRPLYGDVFGDGLEFNTIDKRFDVDESYKHWRWGKPRDPESLLDTQEIGSDDDIGDVKISTPSISKPQDSSQTAAKTLIPNTPREIDRDVTEPGKVPYRVLTERKARTGTDSMMGSSHVYDVGASASERRRETKNDSAEHSGKPSTGEKANLSNSEKVFKF